MPKRNIVTIFDRYQRAGRESALRRDFLRAFVPKMIYRTTKTENPETTLTMVERALRRA